MSAIIELKISHANKRERKKKKKVEFDVSIDNKNDSYLSHICIHIRKFTETRVKVQRRLYRKISVYRTDETQACIYIYI